MIEYMLVILSLLTYKKNRHVNKLSSPRVISFLNRTLFCMIDCISFEKKTLYACKLFVIPYIFPNNFPIIKVFLSNTNISREIIYYIFVVIECLWLFLIISSYIIGVHINFSKSISDCIILIF